MGGFGSGGKLGMGRKRKTLEERALSGARHRTKAADAGAPGEKAIGTVQMPQGMTPGQAMAWESMAPYAEAAGTLTPATAAAFRDLCEVVALRRSMLAQLELDGLMVNVVQVDEDGNRFSLGDPKAHPLLSHERQYRLREEAGRARFMLIPNGKAVTPDQPPADPFAEFDKPTGGSH